MKNKFKIFVNIAMLALCVCAIAVGVYSAKQATVNVGGTVGFTAHDCEVDVTASVKNALRNGTTDTYTDIKKFTTQELSGKYATGWTTLSTGWELGELAFDDFNYDLAPEMEVVFDVTNHSMFPISAKVTFTGGNDNITYETFNANLIDKEATQKVYLRMILKGTTNFDASNLNITVTFAKTDYPKVSDGYQLVKAQSPIGALNSIISVPKATGSNDTLFISPKIYNKEGVLEDVYIYADNMNIFSFMTGGSPTPDEAACAEIYSSLTNGSDYSKYSPNFGGYARIETPVLGDEQSTVITTLFAAASAEGYPTYEDWVESNGMQHLALTFLQGFDETIQFEDGFEQAEMSSNLMMPCLAKSVLIPSSATKVGDDAFYHYTGLTTVNIPSSVTAIGSEAFNGCTSLNSINIPASVTSIGDQSFGGCSSLSSFTIPEGVTAIDSQTFAGCSSLTSITIPSSVTSISLGAFSYCTNLTSITIPERVGNISNDAFSGCTSLTSITIATENAKYDSRDNCNAVIETASNTLIVGCKNTIIPATVISIGIDAFSGCTSLTNFTIPENVKSIYPRAFSGCSNLTRVTFEGATETTTWSVEGSNVNVYDPATNAANLTGTYVNANWHKKS